MELQFPFNGQNKSRASSKQPTGTAYALSNVRPFWEGRLRGGQRPGMIKWGDGDQIGGEEQPVVAMCIVSSVESP